MNERDKTYARRSRMPDGYGIFHTCQGARKGCGSGGACCRDQGQVEKVVRHSSGRIKGNFFSAISDDSAAPPVSACQKDSGQSGPWLKRRKAGGLIVTDSANVFQALEAPKEFSVTAEHHRARPSAKQTGRQEWEVTNYKYFVTEEGEK